MSFCPECDSLLVYNYDNKNFSCPDCEYTEQNEKAFENLILSEEIEQSEKSIIEVVDIDLDNKISTEFREELSEQYREAMSSLE